MNSANVIMGSSGNRNMRIETCEHVERPTGGKCENQQIDKDIIGPTTTKRIIG